jgi:hypothetical protein
MCSVLPPFAAEKPNRNSSLMEFSLQALLVRHEAYMADAEQERLDMMGRIEELEGQKTGLQKTNETLVEENRSLLDQLEALNNAVTESDTRVLSLQSTLQSAQQEMQRLSHLAAKTERLEQQLADFERDHETFHTTLETKEQAEKEATRRWQKAERALADMQSQLDRIEQEAREERERHVEVVGRMERRRAVEKELTSAAGRLKGAAASKTTGRDGSGTSVVSHFVKDILQDNANLQMGIVELREMLQNSNGEVENLRQQLVLHQPLEEEDEEEDLPRPPLGARQASLQDEINRATSQELHVHHHYHAPSNPTAANSRNTLRRPKKKRYGALTPNQFTPPTSGRTTPRSSISYRTPSSMATILQQTAVSVPDSTPHNPRWSVQSNQTYQSLYASSGPGSPQSTMHRTSSIFDRVFSDGGHESSRPTTPDTEPPGSPVLTSSHKSRPSVTSFRTASAPVVNRKGITPGPSLSSISSIPDMSIEDLPSYKPRPSNHHVIAEETEDDWDETSSAVLESTSSGVTPEHRYFDIHNSDIYDRPLRRAASHESLLSISGMDIHTYQSRPKHSLLTQGGVTSGTVVSSAQAHAARPAMATRMETNGHSLLRGVAADQRLSSAPKQTITRKASGWIFGRWGATPGPLDAESSRSTKSASIKSGSDRARDDSQVHPKFPKLRNPGINQSGPILGFGPEIKIHHPPVVKKLDQEELRNVLDEA